MFEVEIKIKLKNKDEFISKIVTLGSKYVTDLIHKDTYYNMPDGLRHFKDTDEALRLRDNTSFEIDSNGNKTNITNSADFTYKGPKLDKTTKSRIENVCRIQDPDILREILKHLGFKDVITISKNRVLYEINYQNYLVEIVIDKIQHLDGFYAEFEIQVETKSEMDEARKAIFELMEKVGYSVKDSIKISYLELVFEALKKSH